MRWSLRTVRLVAAKELLEVRRDRRTLFVALVLPVLLYPLMMVAVGPLVGQQRARMQQEVQRIALTGAGAQAVRDTVLVPDGEQPAPALEVVRADDPGAALRRGDVDLWVEAGAEVAAALRGDGTAELVVHRDTSDDGSRIAYAKWEHALTAASDRLLAARLAERGLPTSFVAPLRMAEVRDTASAEQRAGYSFGRLLALILVLMTLSSSFYPAVDVVAGEKERGPLETLLVAPCRRAGLVLGQ